MAEIVKPSVAELKALRKRLPPRAGFIKSISVQCQCSPSKVSRVLSGDMYDLTIITTVKKVADEYEKNSLREAAKAAKRVLAIQK